MAGAELLAASIGLGIDLAPDAAELHEFLRTHNSLIRSLQGTRPDLFDRLRTQTNASRQRLAA